MPAPLPGPLPFATASLSGIVSTLGQTFGGAKTFLNGVISSHLTARSTNSLVLSSDTVSTGSAVAAVLNSVSFLNTAGDLLLSVQNNFSQVFAITKDGFIKFPDGSVQSTSAAIHSIVNYGATSTANIFTPPTPANDCYPAFVAAIAAFTANGSFSASTAGQIYVPEGRWFISRPVVLPTLTYLKGDGRDLSLVFASPEGTGSGGLYLPSFAGPLFIASSPDSSPPVMTSPPPGFTTGRSLTLSTAYEKFFLHDAFVWNEMEGTSAFSIQFWLNFDHIYSDNGAVISSFSTLSNPGSSAFFIGLTNFSSYQLRFSITTTAGSFGGFGAGTITPSTWYNIELNYDGAHLDAYVDGVNVLHQAATGTLLQKPWEGVTIGAGYDEGTNYDAGFNGLISSIRYSNVARHTGTGSFVPPTDAYPVDSNTLALYNWDQGDPLTGEPFVIGQCTAGRFSAVGQMVKHWVRYNKVLPTGQILIEDMGFGATGYNQSGLILSNCNHLSVHGVEIESTSHYGLLSADANSFYSDFRDIFVQSPYSFGVKINPLTGSNIQILGGRVGGWITTGVISGLTNQPGSGTPGSLAGFIFGGSGQGIFSGIDVTDVSVDTEGFYPDMIAPVVILGDTEWVRMASSTIAANTNAGNNTPAIGFAGTPNFGATFENCAFYVDNDATFTFNTVLGSTSPTTAQVTLTNPYRLGATIPIAPSTYRIQVLSAIDTGTHLISGGPDGSSAVGTAIDTKSAYTTAGAKLLSVRNDNVEKLAITKDGYIEFADGTIQTSAAARSNVFVVNAKSDSGVDQRADIQGAINAVTEYLVGPQISNNAIELSAGQFYISKPLVLVGNNLTGVHIYGQGEHGTTIGPTLDPTYSYPTFQGPTLMWGLQQDWISFGAPLVSGTGQSAQFGQGSNGGSRILVQDARAGRLNGLTAISVEGWFNCTSLTGSTGIITVSGGDLDSAHGAQAMSVYLQDFGSGFGGLQIKGGFNVGGTSYGITPVSISYGSTYNYEFNWDNTTGNILFFLNGVLQQTIPGVHGAISQAFYEDFVIGSQALYAVNFAERWAPINGTMDSMRFSSVARNTSTYSLPTARYASDTHTLLNLDFQTWDAEVGCWVGQTGYLIPYGNMTVYMRGFDALNSALLRSVNSVKMSGITFQGFHYASGIAVNQALTCTWEDLYFFAHSNYALQVLDVNSFYNWASDITVQSDSTWGCAWNVSNGNVDGENILVQYAAWLADLKGTWNTVKLQPGSLTALPARVTTGGNTYGVATIKNLTIDAEVALPTGYLAGVIATGGNSTGPGSITFEDCFLASEGPGSHTQPALAYDNLDYLELRNCRFRVNLNAPAPYAVVRLAAPPSPGRKLTVYNSTLENGFTSAGVSWADHPEDWAFIQGTTTADIRNFGARVSPEPDTFYPRPNDIAVMNSTAFRLAFASLTTDLGPVNTPTGTVVVPAGRWWVSEPVWMSVNSRLTGAGRSQTSIHATNSGSGYTDFQQGFVGPTVIAGQAENAPTFGPDLFGGSGRSLNLANNNPVYLHDSYYWTQLYNTSVFPALTIDGRVKTTTVGSGSYWSVVQSFCFPPDIQPQNLSEYAFGLSVIDLGGGKFWRATLGTTNQGQINLDSAPGSVADSTVYDFSIDWDGSNVRFYINGTFITSAAATGAITQSPFHNVNIGGANTTPESNDNILGPVLPCSIQSLRLSNIARHTTNSNYAAPTAPFVEDSDTKALYNWDQGDAPSGAPWVIGQAHPSSFTGGGLVKHYARIPAGGSGCHIDNLEISGSSCNSGIIFNGCPLARIDNVLVSYTTKWGILAENANGFYSRVSDTVIYTAQQVGACLYSYNTNNVVVTAGGRCQFWLVSGSYVSLSAQPEADTIYSFMLGAGGFGLFSQIDLEGCGTDTEGTFPLLRSGAFFGNDLYAVKTSACNFQGTTETGIPCVLIAGLFEGGWVSTMDLFLNQEPSPPVGLIEQVSSAIVSGEILLVHPVRPVGSTAAWTSTLTGLIRQPVTSILA
jgi:hypothetical protein